MVQSHCNKVIDLDACILPATYSMCVTCEEGRKEASAVKIKCVIDRGLGTLTKRSDQYIVELCCFVCQPYLELTNFASILASMTVLWPNASSRR